MFVTEGAAEKLRQKRKESFYENFIKAMVEEAKRLEISREELKAMMERGFEG